MLPRSGGLIGFTGPGASMLAGTGLTVTHAAADGADAIGLLAVEEWRADDGGTWSPRRLNGDETDPGRAVRLGPGQVGMLQVRLDRFR